MSATTPMTPPGVPDGPPAARAKRRSLGSRTAYSPIGLDAGSHSIKAVQLARSGGGESIHAATSVPRQTCGADLTAPEVLRALGVLRRQGFVGRRAVACIPPAQIGRAHV